MTEDRQYHAIVKGEQHGPFTRAEIAQMASDGRITDQTIAWTDGMTIWRPLAEVPGLHDLLAELPTPTVNEVESFLPDAVEAKLDEVSRSQAFVIGAGIFFALIAVFSIGNIFSFRRLALLGFWGSGALAYVAYQTWRHEENGRSTEALGTAFVGAIGSWVLAVLSLIFGNFFFAVLQAGAGALFWLARMDLSKQTPQSSTPQHDIGAGDVDPEPIVTDAAAPDPDAK